MEATSSLHLNRGQERNEEEHNPCACLLTNQHLVILQERVIRHFEVVRSRALPDAA